MDYEEASSSYSMTSVDTNMDIVCVHNLPTVQQK